MTQEERNKNKDDAEKYRQKAAVAEEQVELLLAQKNDLQTMMYSRVNELGTQKAPTSPQLCFCTFAAVCYYSCVCPCVLVCHRQACVSALLLFHSIFCQSCTYPSGRLNFFTYAASTTPQLKSTDSRSSTQLLKGLQLLSGM